MSDLVEFLLARIAEDEAAARLAIDGQMDPENGWGYEGRALTPHVGIIHHAVQAEHIMRWHPARVLAECEAKRRIVEHETSRWVIRRGVEMGEVTYHRDEVFVDGVQMTALEYGERMREVSDRVRDTPMLRALALPYADHPDYQEVWRP